MTLALLFLWLAGSYALWVLFEASCAVDPDESRVLGFVVVSLWPLVVPIVMVQDLVDWWRDARE